MRARGRLLEFDFQPGHRSIEVPETDFGHLVKDLVAMPIVVEVHNVGDLNLQRAVVAIVEHVLSGRMRDWRVLIVGSQESDRWEIKIFGPNEFERSYTLERTSGEHDPKRIAAVVSRIVS